MTSLRTHLQSAAAFIKENVWLSLSFASGAPSVVLALYAYSKGKNWPAPDVLILCMSCSVVAAWLQWNREHRKRIALEQRRKPNLICSAPYIKIKTVRAVVLSGQTGWKTESGFASALRVFVENLPTDQGTARSANKISARVSVVNQDDNVYFTADGWWPKDIIVDDEKSFEYSQTTDLPPGTKKSLELIFKFDWDDECYGTDSESQGRFEWKNPNLALGKGSYRVKVYLAAENIYDGPFLFDFVNPGRGGELLVPSQKSDFSSEDLTG